jgi:hypothetical protein
MITAIEIANEFGLNPRTLRGALRKARLAWHEHGKHWTVDKGSRQEADMRRIAKQVSK